MSSEQGQRVNGEVQQDADTSHRDLIDAVRSIAAELKQIRMYLQGKDNKFSKPGSSAPRAKFGSTIKPKKIL